jgi:hypothetical protein
MDRRTLSRTLPHLGGNVRRLLPMGTKVARREGVVAHGGVEVAKLAVVGFRSVSLPAARARSLSRLGTDGM